MEIGSIYKFIGITDTTSYCVYCLNGYENRLDINDSFIVLSCIRDGDHDYDHLYEIYVMKHMKTCLIYSTNRLGYMFKKVC